MSHDRRDAVGGHTGTGLVYDDGFYSSSLIGRRWAKRFNRREARREARRITAAALVEFEEDRLEAVHWQAMNELDDFYCCDPFEAEYDDWYY